jgi:hypothetical protein
MLYQNSLELVKKYVYGPKNYVYHSVKYDFNFADFHEVNMDSMTLVADLYLI